MLPDRRSSLAGFASMFALAAIGGCSDSSGGAGGTSVSVVSTDTECKAATTSLPAGKHTFDVANEGSSVTEVYVYGDGDKVIGEVEDIGPGTRRKLTVELDSGSYELACKPGQKGDGIRVPLTVTAAKTSG